MRRLLVGVMYMLVISVTTGVAQAQLPANWTRSAWRKVVQPGAVGGYTYSTTVPSVSSASPTKTTTHSHIEVDYFCDYTAQTGASNLSVTPSGNISGSVNVNGNSASSTLQTPSGNNGNSTSAQANNYNTNLTFTAFTILANVGVVQTQQINCIADSSATDTDLPAMSGSRGNLSP